MSSIAFDTLTDGGAAESVDASYLVHGMAKASASYNQTANIVLSTMNVSSITDDATGEHTISFINAFSTAAYTTVAADSNPQAYGGEYFGVAKTVGNMQMKTAYGAGMAGFDVDDDNTITLGDLA